MTSTSNAGIPNLAEIIAPFLQRVTWEQRPLLVAIAERMAADRYRGWASDATDETRQAGLLECARREEEIAGRVEGLYPEAASIQQEISAKNPDLEEMSRSIFAGRPAHEQFAIQAQGERLGAATWRSIAAKESSSRARETFLACAKLEEESAEFLESILRGES